MTKLEIFNVNINGKDDIEWFMTKTRKQQFDWILKNTNQKNEVLINAFLDSPTVTEYDCCEGCKKARLEQNGNNISKGVSEAVAVGSEVTSIATNDSGTDTKRGKRSKNA